MNWKKSLETDGQGEYMEVMERDGNSQMETYQYSTIQAVENTEVHILEYHRLLLER